MLQTLPETNLITFNEFIDNYPENSENRYELRNGVIVSMPKPKGKHSQIAGYLMTELAIEIKRLQLLYFIPKECIIKADDWSGYEPDVIVLRKDAIKNEPRWEKESTIISGQSIQLVVEIVSSNWSDDYALKLDVYETLGIEEYWIVDYIGLGGRKFIGHPKQPTLTIGHLENSEYQLKRFKQNELIESISFPELKLTTTDLFNGE